MSPSQKKGAPSSVTRKRPFSLTFNFGIASSPKTKVDPENKIANVIRDNLTRFISSPPIEKNPRLIAEDTAKPASKTEAEDNAEPDKVKKAEIDGVYFRIKENTAVIHTDESI